jgi:hypothetical protein
VGEVEKQGLDLTLSKAIEAMSVHTSIVSKNHQVARRLEAQNWVQVGDDFDGEATFGYSGKSVALSGYGKILAIGAPGHDGNGNGSGHVRVLWRGTSEMTPLIYRSVLTSLNG